MRDISAPLSASRGRALLVALLAHGESERERLFTDEDPAPVCARDVDISFSRLAASGNVWMSGSSSADALASNETPPELACVQFEGLLYGGFLSLQALCPPAGRGGVMASRLFGVDGSQSGVHWPLGVPRALLREGV